MGRLLSLLLFLSVAGLSAGKIFPQASTSTAQPPPQQPSSPEPLAIVVNQSNPVENLSITDLRKIFLGERSHWLSGRRITLVMREPGWPERALILSAVCQMDETEFNNHFLRGLFTGEVTVSPKTLATPEGVRKFVFNVPGAIGYLRLSEVDKTVKVIRIDNHLPQEKGYRLHVPLRQNR